VIRDAVHDAAHRVLAHTEAEVPPGFRHGEIAAILHVGEVRL